MTALAAVVASQVALEIADQHMGWLLVVRRPSSFVALFSVLVYQGLYTIPEIRGTIVAVAIAHHDSLFDQTKL